MASSKKQINNALRIEWNKKFSAVNKVNINKGEFVVQLEGVDITCNITHDNDTLDIAKQEFTFPDGRVITFDRFTMNHYAIANCILQYTKSYNYCLATLAVKKELEEALLSVDGRTRYMVLDSLLKNGTQLDEKKSILKKLLEFDNMAKNANFKTDKVSLGKEVKANLYLLRDSLKSKLPNINIIVNMIDEHLSDVSDGLTLNSMYDEYYGTRPNTFFTLVKCLCIIIHPHIPYNNNNSYNKGVNIGNAVGEALDGIA